VQEGFVGSSPASGANFKTTTKMANKAFHIRVKVTGNRVIYLKGVCISESKKKALEYVKNETDIYFSNSTKRKEHRIEIIECKELRTDFLMSTKN
jgi:hypothetical protein